MLTEAGVGGLRRRSVIGIGTSVCVVCSCAGEVNEPPFVEADSAGVTIVHSFRPSWEDQCAWTVDQRPFVSIGVVSGADLYTFDRVMGVRRLRDGGWVVANMGDNTLRFYDASGSVRTQTGGSGAGPAEFSQLTGLDRYGGNLVARQFADFPNKVFTETGEFISALPTYQVPGVRTSAAGIFTDGSMLLSSWPQGRSRTPGVVVRNATFYHATPAGADSILALPAVRFVDANPFAVPQEFGPKPTLLVADSLIYYGWTQTFDIAVYDNEGRLQRRIRRVWNPIPVTADDEARYREFMLTGPSGTGGPVPARLLEQRRQIADAMVFPDAHPAHGALMMDSDRNLWVERMDRPDYRHYQLWFTAVDLQPRSWDVFDTDGVWRGSVPLPARFRVMDIGTDYVAGVWKDDGGVEFVRAYNVAKPCRPG